MERDLDRADGLDHGPCALAGQVFIRHGVLGADPERCRRCIPNWYHAVVSTQIAVRLPDELVAYVDEAVAAGRVRSRAELVARLIERDARRQRAEEDLQRLTERGALDGPELLEIVKSVADTPLPID